MTVGEYGEKIARLAAEGDWASIEAEIHAINAPSGWQAVIRPLFNDLKGRELIVEVIPFDDLPEQVLHWLRLAPADVLRKTPSAVRIAYSEPDGEESSRGNVELAIYQSDGQNRILMVGG